MFYKNLSNYVIFLCFLKILFLLNSFLTWLSAITFYYMMEFTFYFSCCVDYLPGLSNFTSHKYGYNYILTYGKKYPISSLVIYDVCQIISYITFLAQSLVLVIFTIWARAAGPRFRLDQLLSLTWKELFIYLSVFLIFLLTLIVVI